MEERTQNQTSQKSVHPQALKAVLVVDDDKQLASALQWILADENYLVDVAFDGEEALGLRIPPSRLWHGFVWSIRR